MMAWKREGRRADMSGWQRKILLTFVRFMPFKPSVVP